MADGYCRTSFEALRKQAKRLLRALRNGDRTELARLERLLPRRSQVPTLREVQQALAREHGFPSWAALKEHHELTELARRYPELVDEFLQKACIFSGGSDFPHSD